MFILQLSTNQPSEWFEINEAGEMVLRRQIAELSDCPKINENENLVVLIPGESVTMTTVKLPKMRESERLKAIPFALEEQLASDPDSVFIAMGGVQPEGALTVAVTEKALFEERLNTFRAANLYPKILLPDFLSLAWEPETWTVLLQNQMAIVRTDYHNGFSVDLLNLFLFLQFAIEKNKKPKKIICWQENHIVDVTQFEKLGVPVELRGESKYGYFDNQHLLSNPAINFLYGKYKPQMQSSLLKKNWMLCGATAATFIVFLFLSHIGEWFYFRHQSIVLENQVSQVYKTLFPGAQEVLEPRFRAKNILKRFEDASRGSAFLKLLGIAGKTVLTLPAIQMNAVDFENQQLKITVNAKNVAMLSQWSQALQAQGLSVQQRVLRTTTDSVSAEMTVKEGA